MTNANFADAAPNLSSERPKSPLKLLFFIFPILLFSTMEHGIALPVLPIIGARFGADSIDNGLFFSLQYIGQLSMAPFWGWLSDHIGRRNTLLITLTTGALAEVLAAVAWSTPSLLVARLFVGMTAGNIPVASALMSDMTTKEDRSKAMALVGISYGLGFVIGPMIGGSALKNPDTIPQGAFGLGFPFLIAASVMIIAALITLFLTPKPDKYAFITEWNRRVADQKQTTTLQSDEPSSSKLSLSFQAAAMMCFLYLAYTLSMSASETRLPLFLKTVFSLSPQMVGFTFAGIGIVLLTVQGSIHFISKFVNDFWLVAVGGILAGVGYFITGLQSTYIAFFILSCIAALGRGVFYPGLLALASTSYDSPEKTGRVMGFVTSSGAIGRIVGSMVGGYIVNPDFLRATVERLGSLGGSLTSGIASSIDPWLAPEYLPHIPFLFSGSVITFMMILWIIGWTTVQRKRQKAA